VPATAPSGQYFLYIYDYANVYNYNINWIDDPTGKFFFDIESTAQLTPLTVTVNPLTVSKGGTVDIAIEPDPFYGASKWIYLVNYETNDPYVASWTYWLSNDLGCEDYKCRTPQTASFTIPTDWPAGNYYIYIYDYSEPDWSIAYKRFDIEVI